MKPQCLPLPISVVATSPAGEQSKAPSEDPAGPQAAPSEDRSGVAELWTAYWREPTKERRAELVVHYSPLVKYVASRLASGMHGTVERSDLVSYGIFGLIDAIDRFGHDRGCKFETYAFSRIRGAIIDELRRIDWVPRSVRQKAHHVQQAIAELEGTLRRSPTDDELARYLGIPRTKFESTLAQIFSTNITTLEDLAADAEHMTIGDTVASTEREPGDLVADEETRRIVAATIKTLPERERTVLSLYYYENLTLAEIGSVIGVGESRTCQIHARAVLQMRSRMLAQSYEPGDQLSA